MTVVARLRSLLTERYHASIVRRVAVLMLFVGPAFLANLLVYYFTARILSPESFGLFYVAVTITSVAFSGSLVLNIFFTRYLVQTDATPGGDIVAAMRRVQQVVAFWGAIVSIAVFALLTALSPSLGAPSLLVVLLIVVDTYASYLADLGRAFLQSRRQTWQLGCYTLVWTGLRLLLCVPASAFFGSVWATLLASALSPILVFIGFQFLLARTVRPEGALITERNLAPKLPAFAALLPVAIGYGLLMVISNLDILLTYFLFKGQDIGIYSASSVFPKGILVVTMPVSQMLFAMMLGDHESQDMFRITVRKTILVTAALSVAASIGILLLSPWLCGDRLGLTLCAPVALHTLVVSAVLLSVLRVTVLLELVRQRDWLVLTLIFPTAAYLFFAWYSNPGVERLALQFTIFSVGSLVFFSIVHVGANIFAGRRAAV